MTMTYHAREERRDRLYLIEKYIGMGTPIKEIPATSKKFCGRAKAILTNTGIIIVKDKLSATIITVIIPKFMYIKQNFYPTDLVPWEIQMAISRNKKYAELIDTLEAL